ncbi:MULTISPECIES: hypothetical protein [unclassified Nocardioides]|uniref:hypothetical protein n=1 Tax=unclassified Nocardioides TaxID=2615069 RepID=UPI0006F26796|nr:MULTISPECIES: hypothetical protein [unclassified Nocardioides]KRA28177.1 hypothetical protein ASD81_23800 [Nocardioides sp. Root614]KRA86151.1 hypothetical protein ASD84_24040 [Nocardioides sp. Root682]
MSEDFDADALDTSIDDVLTGRVGSDADPGLLWLAAASRPTPPASLLARIDAQMQPAAVPERIPARQRPFRDDRPSLFLSAVAAALSFAFVFQAMGNIVAGDWIAENLGEPHGPHAYFEGALAMTAAAVCALAAAVRRSWAGVSVLSCSPLALSLGIHGLGEIGQFAAGAILHVIEGTLGLLLIGAWWWDRRDTLRRAREELT